MKGGYATLPDGSSMYYLGETLSLGPKSVSFINWDKPDEIPATTVPKGRVTKLLVEKVSLF